jgi:hypothetical protein
VKRKRFSVDQMTCPYCMVQLLRHPVARGEDPSTSSVGCVRYNACRLITQWRAAAC